MEAGGWSGYRTLVLCENGLVVLCILRLRSLLYPGRDRGLSEGEEGLFELLVRSVEEETEGPAAGSGVVDDLGHETLVLAEVELVAYAYLPGRVHDHVPEALLPVQFPEEVDLDGCAGLFLVAVESCGEYLGVIQDEGVALSEVFDDVLEEFVLDFAAVLVEDHQLALVPPSRWVLCYLVRIKGELEL